MARSSNRVNVEWQTPSGTDYSWDHVQLELLMDIRAELQRLNQLLYCDNFVGIPRTLRAIQRKLPVHPKKKVARG